MAKRQTPLPVAPVYRILRKAGADRVGQDAKLAMVEVLYEIAQKIARRAAELAKHSKRKTLQEEDIRIAVQELRGL